jgi:outer membrane protein OmpA-like peptidoglycan-associated protein
MQRAAVQCRIESFSVEETDAYIRHRMMVAGYFLRIFTPEAVAAIRRFSGGVPKAIDQICDRALMRARFEKQRTIDKKSITRYAKEAHPAFGIAKGWGLSSEGNARLKEKVASSGWIRFRKAAPVGIALAVVLLLTAGMPFLNFQEEKPPPVATPPPSVSIYFEFASTSLPGHASSELERVADFLSKNPNARVTIKGYTDLKGSQQYNMRMAQSRADAAKSYLTERGIEPARVQAVGMGAEESSDGGRKPGDPKLSRRVEITIGNNSLTLPANR